jgi:hypothetical protein
MDVAQDLPKARTKSHIGRNIPIFGKALIVAAVSLALAGHDPLNVQNCGGDKSVEETISDCDEKVSDA